MDPITNADPTDPANVLVIFRAIGTDWTWPNCRVLLTEHTRVVPRSYTVAKLKSAWAWSDGKLPGDAVDRKILFKARVLADEEACGFGLEDGSVLYVLDKHSYVCADCDEGPIMVKFLHATVKDATDDRRIVVCPCDMLWDLKVRYKRHTGQNPNFFDFEHKGVRLGDIDKKAGDSASLGEDCNLEGDVTLQVVSKS